MSVQFSILPYFHLRPEVTLMEFPISVLSLPSQCSRTLIFLGSWPLTLDLSGIMTYNPKSLGRKASSWSKPNSSNQTTCSCIRTSLVSCVNLCLHFRIFKCLSFSFLKCFIVHSGHGITKLLDCREFAAQIAMSQLVYTWPMEYNQIRIPRPFISQNTQIRWTGWNTHHPLLQVSHRHMRDITVFYCV